MTVEIETVRPLTVEPKQEHHNESYQALVWRRLKRSWTGKIGRAHV